MRCALLSLFLLSLPVSTFAQTSSPDVSSVVNPFQTSERFFKQPDGPFAVMTFPEDALGMYIGVIWHDLLGSVIGNDEPWGLSERFWQDYGWGADVINFAWSPDGKYLVVATSEIYNAGAVHALKLRGRIYRRIYPLAGDDIDQIDDMLMPRIIGFEGGVVLISAEDGMGKQYEVVRRRLEQEE